MDSPRSEQRQPNLPPLSSKSDSAQTAEEMDMDGPATSNDITSSLKANGSSENCNNGINEATTNLSSNSGSDDAAAQPNGAKSSISTISASQSEPNGDVNPSGGRPTRRVRPKRRYDDTVLLSADGSWETQHQVWSQPVEGLDTAANILAEIDEESYHESILKDADQVLHSLILPMSYPWDKFQPTAPEAFRNFPKDIDEMEDIVNGNIDADGQSRDESVGLNHHDVARRTDDSGVIELSIYDKDTLTSKENCSAKSPESRQRESSTPTRRSARKRDESTTEKSSDNHYLLEYVRHLDVVKKQKLNNNCGHKMNKKLVSVRFGSVSSRTSILSGNAIDDTAAARKASQRAEPKTRSLIVVAALLPSEVHAGRSLILPSAVKTAKELGSYNMRYGLPPDSSKSLKRQTCGRTRLMWTKAHLGAGKTDSLSSRHRLAYSSMLTGKRIDIANFRRPRNVAVSVRVNGVRLMKDKTDSPSPKSVIGRSSHYPGESVAAAVGLTDRTISAAITAATGTKSGKKTAANSKKVHALPPRIETTGPQCILREDDLVQKIVKERRAHFVAARKAGKVKMSPTSGTKQVEDMLDNKNFVGPVLDCFPSTDGLLRVVCTSPGHMKCQQVAGILDLNIGNETPKKCTVCFTEEDTDKVETCLVCGVAVHISCCLDKGTRPVGGDGWVCSICDNDSVASDVQIPSRGRRKPRLPSRFRFAGSVSPDKVGEDSIASSAPCQLCPHYGGAMSFSAKHQGNIHEVCRIWTSQCCKQPLQTNDSINSNPMLDRFHSRCTLCGKTTQDNPSHVLLKCAAAGCHVRFHPMCGLLASNIATSETQGEMPTGKLERMRVLDTQLCKQYTLTMMKCTTSSDEGETKTAIQPVVFCGLHNPIRDTSLYGCYPGGGAVGKAMIIPSV